MTEDFEVVTRSDAERRRQDAERDVRRWKSEAYRVSEELIAAQQTIAELRVFVENHHSPGVCCLVCNVHADPHRGCFLR